MNKKIIFSLLIIFSFFSSLLAQNKTGTTIGQFLKIDPSARASAMANATHPLITGSYPCTDKIPHNVNELVEIDYPNTTHFAVWDPTGLKLVPNKLGSPGMMSLTTIILLLVQMAI